jgi:hypothetical protein
MLTIGTVTADGTPSSRALTSVPSSQHLNAPVPRRIEVVRRIMAENVSRVRGIKMSLLDAGHEVALRAQYPVEQSCSPATTTTTSD